MRPKEIFFPSFLRFFSFFLLHSSSCFFLISSDLMNSEVAVASFS